MSLLQTTRYRFHVLREDRGTAMWVLGIAAVACAFYTRNDVVLFSGTRVLWLLFATRAVVVTACFAALLIVRTTKSPQRFDCSIAVATITLGVATLVIGHTRNGQGEHLGQIVTNTLLLTTAYFFLRGALWYRVTTAILVSIATVLAVWAPAAQTGTVTRTSLLIGTIALNAFGVLLARTHESERRRRFEAERKASIALRTLAAEKENALSLSRTRTAFLTAMSHEFRTPMNAVIGLSEMLAAGRLEPEQKEHARAIRDSAKGLLALLNDILDFAKIDAERLTLSPSPFEVRRLTTSVIAMMRSSLKNKPQVSLDLQIGADVPDVVLSGDEPRLRQVLVNLLSNAIKFTEKGRVLLEVTSRPRSGGAHEVTFRVIDTGIGISEEAQSRLFRPFEQADQGIDRRYGGTGLGLAISKRIVEAMGGNIKVKSELGRGSEFRFKVRLPVATGTAQLSGTWTRGGIPAPKMAVLLVDDHAVNRQVAQAALRKLGQTPDLAADGTEAIAAAASKRYDLIFMDLQMPKLGGIEATRRILASSQNGSPPHIVAMTASVMETDRAACLAAGMRGFLGKPIEMGELAETLTRVAAERGGPEALVGLPTTGDRQSEAPLSKEPVVERPPSNEKESPPLAAAPSPEEASRDEVATLDAKPLDTLRALSAEVDPGFVASVCREFMRDATDRLDEIQSAFNRADLAKICAEAHTLRGGAASVGATDFYDLLGRIEALGLTGKEASKTESIRLLAETKPLLAEARRELARVERALRIEIESGTPGL